MSNGAHWIMARPSRVVVVSFAGFLALGTLILLLPVSRAGDDGSGAPFIVAIFTATGASCGALTIVDTATYWSTFGQVVILALIQLGGFGIMALASLLGLAVSRRMGLRWRLTAAEETQTVGLGDVRTVLTGVFKVTLVIEAVLALILTLRFWLGHDQSLGRALWHGVFHSISAFNNAGYALYTNNMVDFVDDPWIIIPIGLGCTLGALGFPVIFELMRRTPRRRWSLNTRMTLWGTAVMMLGGGVCVTIFEWSNPATMGELDLGGKLLAGFFQPATARTAGFNSIDYAQAHEETLLVTDIVMFVGGGSASTAGGIKVTTFFLLLFVILAEVRGDANVTIGDRRIDPRAQRQALTVALVGVAVVVAPTLVLMAMSDQSLSKVLFEVISAFGTVGASSGVTAELPAAGHLILIFLMFLGRVGSISLVSALALRDQYRAYEYPEGRPLIG
ncbi:TrkH family potassium uptake protein [Nocardioides speluncae]|uniref:TrkH family potassium uptake protein n=1 Tax=Nocardioides speluncae TaxID=2670337 RepID=UPI000D68D78C|nr:potassium transporter TrkG [Nocardioides speluncae]